jgi:7-cyano-7-deazaguanine synthase
MMRSAVLVSGGLDSAVLMAMELGNGFEVWPIRVRSHFAWERAEAAMLERLLATPPFAGRVQPATTVTMDMRDVYPATHWAVSGHPPGYEQPDEDVYLEGRNIALTAKTAVLASRQGIERIVLGPLAGNPFPDATPDFFAAMSRALSIGLGRPIHVEAPLRNMHKADVIRTGLALGVRLDLTLSCMNPMGGGHCGRCNKCRERHEAFRDAGVADPAVFTFPGSEDS